MTLESEAATQSLAGRIAGELAAGDVVALCGDLGAGKTTLARGILRSLGVTERVPSPTFTLVQAYETPSFPVHHFDLYRLRDPKEISELGFEDAIAAGAAIVEWPEHGLPSSAAGDALFIALSARGDGTRQAAISGPERWRAILADLP